MAPVDMAPVDVVPAGIAPADIAPAGAAPVDGEPEEPGRSRRLFLASVLAGAVVIVGGGALGVELVARGVLPG
ncbi:MAG: hypothetical protein M0Z62_10310, partial [Actinomycetota bacterium]|nr:hypothetical protein [Actinomycetota bacterium]